MLSTQVLYATGLSGIPAFCMLMGSLAVLFVNSVNEKLQAALQNFSAGIIIAAVGSELFPLLGKGGAYESVGMAVGFVGGLALLYGLEELTEEHEDEKARGSDVDLEGIQDDAATGFQARDCETDPLFPRKMPRKMSMRSFNPIRIQYGELVRSSTRIKEFLALYPDVPKYSLDRELHILIHEIDCCRSAIRGDVKTLSEEEVEGVTERMDALQSAIEHMGENGEKMMRSDLDDILNEMEELAERVHEVYEPWQNNRKFKRWNIVPAPPSEVMLSNKLPYSMITAVALDTFVDGFLIGLTYVASPKAGMVMAFATCIEMGFLGLTFSAQLRACSHNRIVTLSIATAIPFLMLVGGMVGSALANAVEEQPAVFVAFIAFCVVALLFLVTQELLVEAREVSDNKMVTSAFFMGVLLALLVSRVGENFL